MTPAELITRHLMSRLATGGVSLPVQSLLVEALEGEKKSVASSGVLISCHVAEQLAEPLPLYTFAIRLTLVAAIDDDKSGSTFAENYGAIWDTLHDLAQEDNCTTLGDEDDDGLYTFAVDGFQITGGDEPTYEEDDNGGTWTTTFTATLTGRAN